MISCIGKSLTITQDRLGKGSYGSVHKCINDVGHEMAAKCIKCDDYGIPSLLECSIMSTMCHPNLSYSDIIDVKSNNLYIIQPLAISDLAKATRGKQHSIDQIRTWCFQITQALYCLHYNRIIHGDLKASNILLFEDNNVKLSDFTLSTYKWDDSKFNYRIGTTTHNSPEVNDSRSWNESTDIWSLGCTIFEITYGYTLFQNQLTPVEEKRYNADQNVHSKTRKEFNALSRQRQAYAHNYWNAVISGIQCDDIKGKFFFPPMIPDDFGKNEIDTLIISMLKIDDLKRPTISDVIQHPFFKKCYRINFKIFSTQSYPCTSKEVRLINILCDEYEVNNVNIRRLTTCLYSRTFGIRDMTEDLRRKACLFIASKIVSRRPIEKFNNERYQIIQCEYMICKYLSFRLHLIDDCNIIIKDNR